ncbi:hypothetical protein CLAM6_05730 [Cobetia sp. AM6]|nr:hypothetical protein CLAM6_05730 [Cobetia sp. AM6]
MRWTKGCQNKAEPPETLPCQSSHTDRPEALQPVAAETKDAPPAQADGAS